MCGRYRLSRRKQIIEEHFNTADWQDDWSPRYNIAPTQPVPVIRQHPKEPIRQISTMRWGLVPRWAKDSCCASMNQNPSGRGICRRSSAALSSREKLPAHFLGEAKMADDSQSAEKLRVRCCVAGGGPAGVMLGFLLARAGIDVMVLEKHADFLRDFRGDTVHPSTLETIHELGLLQEFLKRPHQEISQVRARIGGDDILLGEMSHLRTRCRFMALMPQWDFLDFLAEQGSRYPTFHLRMRAEVTGLIEENGCIVGIRANTPDCLLEVRADLVVGADGRNSVVRERAGFEVQDVGASMDALQVRLSKRADDPKLFLYSDRGKTLVTIDRGDYWHCGFAVPKGTAEKMQARGIEDFRASIAEVAPFLRDRVTELRDWRDVKLLTGKADRLRKW